MNIALGAASIVLALASGLAFAQDRDPMLLYDEHGLRVRGHILGSFTALSEQNLSWGLADTIAPGSDFDTDTNTLEVFIKPGLSFQYDLGSTAQLYGALSAVASYTFGTDAFDAGNTGDVTLEEAFLALRGDMSEGLSYDVSLGARELRLGTGMLIANGGADGFERGGVVFGQRNAWERSAIARLTAYDVTGTAFYVDPNELPSQDDENELAGLDLRYDDPRGGYLGVSFIDVLKSNSIYAQAAPGGLGAPTIIPGAREGTQTINIYAGTSPFSGALKGWSFTADLAFQRNDRIDMRSWAGRVTASYAFSEARWKPTLTYRYQTFSGDDPDTSDLEAFDPLYYDGSPNAWATGSKGALTFLNSNLQAHSVALQVQPSQRDTFKLSYAHVRANELNSPLYFGQTTRADGETGIVVNGVRDAHLSDEIFLEYFRVINPNTFLTAGVLASYPGAGVDDIAGRTAKVWTGGFVNLIISF